MFKIEFLDELRMAELDLVAADLRPGARVLEFGAGTGAQARALAMRGFDVVAIDVARSGYAQSRVFPIVEYDGRSIPLPDASIDVVFSSNVLEHVHDLAGICAEFRRILRPGGYAVHVMPSVAWRFWTFASGLPTSAEAAICLLRSAWQPAYGLTRRQTMFRHLKTMVGALLPIGHGTSWEGFSELWTFSTRAWMATLAKNGFRVVSCRPIGLFHTGHMALGPRLAISERARLSTLLGSAATVYVVHPINPR